MRELQTVRRLCALAAGFVAFIGGATAGASTVPVANTAVPVFATSFDGPDALITNEFAYRNAGDPSAAVSPEWDLTSGSLFVRDGHAWSGLVDAESPDPASAEHTGSAVLRAHPRVTVDGDSTVSLALRPLALAEDGQGEQVQAWDGFHVLVRFKDDRDFYAVSVLRRDGVIVIKRKTAGGPSNGGTYDTLAEGQLPMGLGDWHAISVETVDRDGAVRITLWIDGVPVLEAFDAGELGPPLTGPAGVALRGDNLEFEVDDLVITQP